MKIMTKRQKMNIKEKQWDKGNEVSNLPIGEYQFFCSLKLFLSNKVY